MRAALVLILAIAHAIAQQRGPLFEPAPGSPFAVGASPSDVTTSDVNNDRNMDIISPCTRDVAVAVLLGDGKGRFRHAPGSPFKVEMPMHLAALGDLNRDGKQDLVLTSHDSNAVTILAGEGTGRFSRFPGSPFVARPGGKAHNHGLALGDVNGDGRLDIVTGDQDDNSVSVLLNDTQGGFVPVPDSPFRVGKGPYPLALADTNLGGSLDIVTPNTGSHDVTLLLGNGKGQFTPGPGSPVAVGKRPYYIVAGDLNGDRKPDLVTAHGDNDLITILPNDGRGAFKRYEHHIGSRAWGVVLADVNGDRRTDLSAATNDSVTVLFGDGGGSFWAAPGSPFPTGGGSWKAALGDVNRDGHPDIVANNLEKNSVTVLLGR